MGASLIISVFLAFSLSLSWFSGDKENGMLEDTIAETRAEQEVINQSYQLLTIKMRAKDAEQRALKGKLDRELKKQKKLKRKLALEQRKMRMAVEAGTAVDIEGEREKIRKEVEERASKEIAKLEKRINTIEREKQRLEENARNGLTAKNENTTEGEGWAQAELARARAREATAQYKALKAELNELRTVKESSLAASTKSAEQEALDDARSKRTALEARLIAAEKTLKASATAEMEKNTKDESTEALIAEMEKASIILRREIEQRDQAITELERNAKISVDNEKQTLRSALEQKARKIAELEQELNLSKTREETLRANLNKGTSTTTARRASEPVDSERIDALRAKIISLQAKLQEVENTKQDFADQAKAEIDLLRRKTQQLETKNTDMEKGLKASGPLKAKTIKEGEPLNVEALKEGGPLKAEASQYGEPLKAKSFNKNQPLRDEDMPIQAETLKEGGPLKAEAFDDSMPLKAEASRYGEPLKAAIRPAEEMTSGLMDNIPELQTRVMNNGLVDLQSQATSYIAQKMIDRNVELEAQLQDTRIQLAEAQSAYRDANAGFSGKNQFDPGREDTRVIISRYRKAATTITALNQRNVELEARASDTARALAEAEAARFIIEKLQARNRALEERFNALEREAFYKKEAAAAAVPVEASINEAAPVEDLSRKIIPEGSGPQDERALPALNNNLADADLIDVEVLNLPLEYSPAPETPVILASINNNTGPLEQMHAITETPPAPAITASTPKAVEKDKELYKIIRAMEDMNYALQTIQNGSNAARPSLAEIHEEVRKLKKTILQKIDEGSVTLEDIIRNTGDNAGLTFYMVQKGDTPQNIAGKKELYGDPSLWPLIYRYNQSRLSQDDIIKSSRLLIIYNHLSGNEKEDASKKAREYGDWDKWNKADKRALIEDWIM